MDELWHENKTFVHALTEKAEIELEIDVLKAVGVIQIFFLLVSDGRKSICQHESMLSNKTLISCLSPAMITGITVSTSMN